MSTTEHMVHRVPCCDVIAAWFWAGVAAKHGVLAMHRFYWVIDNVLAGCSRPGAGRDGDIDRDLATLRGYGIGALLTLTETALPLGSARAPRDRWPAPAGRRLPRAHDNADARRPCLPRRGPRDRHCRRRPLPGRAGPHRDGAGRLPDPWRALLGAGDRRPCAPSAPAPSRHRRRPPPSPAGQPSGRG